MSDKCGTYAGWNDHVRRGHPTCAACRAFKAAYQRRYRRDNGDDLNVARMRARSRALSRLRRAHLAEFGVLFQEELERSEEPARV